MRTALTIAGSDSSGGAGIQADLKTFAALGVYGTSAITAVTAQNTTRRRQRRRRSPPISSPRRSKRSPATSRFTRSKTGMLANAAIVEAVAAAIAELELPLVVVDPVLVSTSGDRLLDDDGVQMLCTELLPRARVVTPNIPEAEALSGRRIRLAGRCARGGAAHSRPRAVGGDHHRRPRAEDGHDEGRRSAVRRPRVHRVHARRGRHDAHARHRLHVRVGGRREPRARRRRCRDAAARGAAIRRRRDRARAARSATATARSIISGARSILRGVTPAAAWPSAGRRRSTAIGSRAVLAAG